MLDRPSDLDVGTGLRGKHDRRVSKTFATLEYQQGGPTAEDRVRAYTSLPSRYYCPEDECMQAKIEGFAKAQNFLMSFKRTSSKASISVLKPQDLSSAPSAASPAANSTSGRLHSGSDRDEAEQFPSELLTLLQSDDDDEPPSSRHNDCLPSPPVKRRPAVAGSQAAPNTGRRRSVQMPDPVCSAEPPAAGRCSVEMRGRRRSIGPQSSVAFSVRLTGKDGADEDEYVPLRSSKSMSRLASLIYAGHSSEGRIEHSAKEEVGGEEEPGQGRARAGPGASDDYADADDETQRLMAKAFCSLQKAQSNVNAGIEAKKEKLGLYRSSASLPFNAVDWGSKSIVHAKAEPAPRFKGKPGKPSVLLGGLHEQPEAAAVERSPKKAGAGGHALEPLSLLDDMLGDLGMGSSPKYGASCLRSPDPMKSNKLLDDRFDELYDELRPKPSAASFRSPDPLSRRSYSSLAGRSDPDAGGGGGGGGGGGSPKFSAAIASMRTPDPLSRPSMSGPLLTAGDRPGTSSSSGQHNAMPLRSKSSLDVLPSSHLKVARRPSVLRPKGADAKSHENFEELMRQCRSSSSTTADQVCLPPVQRADLGQTVSRGSFLRDRMAGLKDSSYTCSNL